MTDKTETAPEAPTKPVALPFTPTVKRRVTLPLSKWIVGQAKYVRFEGKIFKGKEIKGTKGGVKMEPADLANVIDLATGEMVQIICGTVLQGNLTEAYPDHSYVGRCYEIVQHSVANKRYKDYSITEIDDPLKPSGK